MQRSARYQRVEFIAAETGNTQLHLVRGLGTCPRQSAWKRALIRRGVGLPTPIGLNLHASAVGQVRAPGSRSTCVSTNTMQQKDQSAQGPQAKFARTNLQTSTPPSAADNGPWTKVKPQKPKLPPKTEDSAKMPGRPKKEDELVDGWTRNSL